MTARYGKGTDSDATDATDATDAVVAGTLEARTEAGGFPGTDGACAGHVVAHTPRSEGADNTPTVLAFNIYPAQGQGAASERGTRVLDSCPPVAFTQNQREEVRLMDVAGALSGAPDVKRGSGTVLTALPRRLTPRECERLQGWPDDWTKYGRTEAGTVVLSDSARYRMAGNGVSGPVAEWIGLRIVNSE